MAKSPLLTDDVQKIIDCSLYNDPRVSVKRHRFCIDCSERKNTGENPCPLCRTFQEVRDTGCHGYPGSYIKEKLSDLHQQYVEKSLRVTGEKQFDVSLVVKFKIRKRNGPFYMTWLEHKIYVMCGRVKSLRVFDDHAPFKELPEVIGITGLIDAVAMSASLSTRSIFISDTDGRCLWKIQIPQKEVKRFPFPFKYSPGKLSVTRDDELLVVKITRTFDHAIDIFRVADVSLVKSIPLPGGILHISDLAQSPNRDIVMAYLKKNHGRLLSILSMDGEIIRTFDLSLFGSFRSFWDPYSFAITDTGDIFVADLLGGMIYLVDSRLTDYQIVSIDDLKIRRPLLIIFISEKQQLLVDQGTECDASGKDLETVERLSLLHLSPCSVKKNS